MSSSPVASVTRFRHDAPRRFGHRHENGQLFLLFKGLARLETPAKDAGLHGNWFGWIPGQTRHEVSNTRAISGISISVEPGMAARFPSVSMVSPANRLVVELLRYLVGAADPERQTNILNLVADELAGKANGAASSAQGPSADLIAALQADPASPLRLAAWARALGTSERTLARHLKAETGKSFVQLRTELRIARARELLAFGSSVTEASLAVGYDSPSAFSRCFYNLTGQQPSAFRSTSAPKGPTTMRTTE
jgi:AraC-like DNA-binding protein